MPICLSRGSKTRRSERSAKDIIQVNRQQYLDVIITSSNCLRIWASLAISTDHPLIHRTTSAAASHEPVLLLSESCQYCVCCDQLSASIVNGSASAMDHSCHATSCRNSYPGRLARYMYLRQVPSSPGLLAFVQSQQCPRSSHTLGPGSTEISLSGHALYHLASGTSKRTLSNQNVSCILWRAMTVLQDLQRCTDTPRVHRF